MTFEVLEGKNKKFFVALGNIKTKEDLELQEIVRTVCSRSEHKPFLQGFNKTVSYTYFYNESLFPVQFWDDVQKQLKAISKQPIVLLNEDMLYDNDINWEEFSDWIKTLKVPEDISTDDEKYQFQQEACFEALKNKCARIEIGTSGGKTFITYLYCKWLKQFKFPDSKDKLLIIVPSKDLVKQLQKDFDAYQKHEDNKLIVESIYSGATKFLDSHIVCGTFHSLREYDADYFKDFRVVICDEVHGAKAYSIKNEIYTKTLESEYFFGMSGTHPKYKTLDYLHLVSMFGKLVYKRETWQLIESGVSTPVKIEIIKINYKEPYDKFSLNLKEQGIINKEKYQEEKVFFHRFEPRTELVGKLLRGFVGNSLIMVDTVEYCQMLKDYLEPFINKGLQSPREFRIIHGKIDNRYDIYDEMRGSKDFTIIATFGTMSTGVNIKNIDYLHLPDGGKSEIRIRQTIGRGIRLFPEKEYCVVFDYYDNMQGCAFKNHALERIKIYKQQKFPFKTTEILIG